MEDVINMQLGSLPMHVTRVNIMHFFPNIIMMVFLKKRAH